MAARTWSLLAALLIAFAAFAGCTAKNDGGDEDAPAPPPAGGNEPSDDDTPPPPPPAASPPPSDFTLADSGEIQGSFDKTWDIQVANVAFTDAGIRFALEGLQPGAPPTARIHLALYDPNGAPIKTGSVGLGAETNALEWGFTPGQLPQAGTYKLKATSAQEAPLPSAGFAAYELAAAVIY